MSKLSDDVGELVKETAYGIIKCLVPQPLRPVIDTAEKVIEDVEEEFEGKQDKQEDPATDQQSEITAEEIHTKIDEVNKSEAIP